MRMIRSLCYVGLASLAMFATMLVVSHSRGFSYEPLALAIEAVNFDTLDAIVIQPEFVQAVIPAIPRADRDMHAAIYTSQSQPGTQWRFSVDAYRLIDPDIAFA